MLGDKKELYELREKVLFYESVTPEAYLYRLLKTCEDKNEDGGLYQGIRKLREIIDDIEVRIIQEDLEKREDNILKNLC